MAQMSIKLKGSYLEDYNPEGLFRLLDYFCSRNQGYADSGTHSTIT